MVIWEVVEKKHTHTHIWNIFNSVRLWTKTSSWRRFQQNISKILTCRLKTRHTGGQISLDGAQKWFWNNRYCVGLSHGFLDVAYIRMGLIHSRTTSDVRHKNHLLLISNLFLKLHFMLSSTIKDLEWFPQTVFIRLSFSSFSYTLVFNCRWRRRPLIESNQFTDQPVCKWKNSIE